MASTNEPTSDLGFPDNGDIPRERRVYVNRTLRMDKIDLIGFDMDHTLAVYRQEPTETLALRATVGKLIKNLGYSAGIADLDYDARFAIRGLCVDKQLGNLLKMDRHGHIGRVLHGRRPLAKDERYELYRSLSRVAPPRFAWIDSLFALPEGAIYARLVEHFDAQREPCDYVKLWDDVRACIDEAHRDGSIKSLIRRKPDEYFVRDPDLSATLHKFRSAGRRLFLLTNSEWDYTNDVMTWLLGGEGPYPSWRLYFDFIVVLARKPEFFTHADPFVEIDEDGHDIAQTRTIARGRLYRGGNIADFEAHVGSNGDRILYVGDHIYSDILRSKRSSAWRTALVVQELEGEIACMDQLKDEIGHLKRLEHDIARLDAEVNYFQSRLKALQKQATGVAAADELGAAKRLEKEHLDRARMDLRNAVARCNQLQDKVDAQFHRFWGPLFKEEEENSKFGEQVEDYACVYTSRVTNFLAYSPIAYFRAPRQHMPHER